MENQFTDLRTGKVIYAPLNATLIHATMRPCDLIPAFLEAIRDTVEYVQLKLAYTKSNTALDVINDADATDTDARWDSDEVSFFLNEELWEIMESYAPEGYFFGSHPGDGSDYGYWKNEQ